MNPSANPSMMLPPSLLRNGQTTPGQLFQQNPLSQNMSPSAMGADPSLMQQPAPGSQANNPTMPGQMPMPQAGMQQPNGQPDSGTPQLSEAQYILNALADRLKHHSKITEKTVNTLSDMIAANGPQSPDQQQAAPTA
jgi:hypothetical protein